jgi:hypothetical protein
VETYDWITHVIFTILDHKCWHPKKNTKSQSFEFFTKYKWWRGNLWLDITRCNNSFFIQRWVFHSSADSTSNCVISHNMAKLSFIALTIFLSIFNNLLSSYALYGSSSPVLQLTPSNFKSKVNFRFLFVFQWPSSWSHSISYFFQMGIALNW